jgi:hypothetical protein
MTVLVILVVVAAGNAVYGHFNAPKPDNGSAVKSAVVATDPGASPAAQSLGKLEIKGRAPKTGYARNQFSDGWAQTVGCDVRNFILKRDMTGVITKSATDCTVMQGNLLDPYTGKTVMFVRGASTSDDVQIDHVVSLSNAWQTGAQQISAENRHLLANDPLNLLAVDGPTNQAKSDGDAATWLPPNKDYRCRYVARQIAVKLKYTLWVTQAEHDAMQQILASCPDQVLPVVTPSS